MRFLGYAYRFLSNFVFLTRAYFSLNFMEKYQQSAQWSADSGAAICGDARGISCRSFYFFQRIERLELEARRLAGAEWPGRVRRAQADRHGGRHTP